MAQSNQRSAFEVAGGDCEAALRAETQAALRAETQKFKKTTLAFFGTTVIFACLAINMHMKDGGSTPPVTPVTEATNTNFDMRNADQGYNYATDSTPAATFDLTTPAGRKEALHRKQGMNANQQVDRAILDMYTDVSSWFWTYSLMPNPSSLAWAIENNMEFVPLVNLKKILPEAMGSCSFQAETCTVDMIVDALEAAKATGVKMQYLMGYNEPYAGHQEASSYGSKGLKVVSGAEGADWWRKYVQPAAQKTGLKLVSPTTGMSEQKAGWMIEFLKACYDNRKSVPPCDVSLIKVFSVHEYKCYAGYWRKYAAADGGDSVNVKDGGCKEPFKPRVEINIYTVMRNAMREEYGDDVASSFWDVYFDSVKLWVTETSCSGDFAYDKVNKKGNTDVADTPTRQASCEAITGQSKCKHQEGSVDAILNLTNIERFSWFTLFPHPPTTHPNYNSITAAAMVNFATKKPTGVGRYLLGMNADEANCAEE